MTIPKIIHQTVPDANNLDELVSENIAKLSGLNKKWEYRLYDDAECRRFISDCYGSDMLSYYDMINPLYGAARADLFRYLLLYEHGGVYLDIKSTADRPLDEVLRPDDAYLLSQWKNGRGEVYEDWGVHHPSVDGVLNEYQQWHIAAAPKHPFLEAVIAKVKRNIDGYSPFTDGVGKAGVVKLTGPIAYTSAILPIAKHHRHRLVDSEDLGLRYSIFPSTHSNKYGHVEIFASHYTVVSEPIIRNRTYGTVEELLIKNLHQYRSAYRGLRKLIERRIRSE